MDLDDVACGSRGGVRTRTDVVDVVSGGEDVLAETETGGEVFIMPGRAQQDNDGARPNANLQRFLDGRDIGITSRLSVEMTGALQRADEGGGCAGATHR